MKEIMDIERVNGYLRQFDLEHLFSEPLRKHLALYQFEPDETLCLQGEEPQFLFFLVSGKVKVFTTSTEGRTLLINFTTPLGIIGEIECLRDRVNLNTVKAVSPVETIGIHKRWLSQYGVEAPFLRFLLDMVTDKFYTKSLALSSNLLNSVEVRLASYLLSVSFDDEKESYSSVRISSIKDTANLIGTSYRHLNRVLRSFSSAGLVERRKGILVVIDRKGLTEVAGRNIYESSERRKGL
ncbi:cyclic nucleotide-binding domain-containing protein [Paenibacillus sp. GSMTC-2017]|uniref:Crp/Fnr family transcriptional regulator n=1 Tax=Paenibacillus sp. GSMTC-2017 TaxID=2794350 RepID=UPI0018D8E934|nr:cyclic nucleotide-binding domain-containing protein [Paenibacillus sp. GSMTC-2017]MBH5319475.1 cyclic nucleotide-binding domain-containing protein [Paenibacillus sp. GSMTC-2017]